MSLIDQDKIQILNGASLSGALLLGDKTLCGFTLPASWTGTTVTFQTSYDGGTTWAEYWDSKAGSGTITVAAGQYVVLDPNMWRGVNAIKMRSGTSGAATNQAADRDIYIASKRVF